MTEKNDYLSLDRQLCFAIYAAGHAFTRFYKPRLEALNLTYPQYLVMLVLWEQDDLTVKSIGDKLFLDSGTLTPLLKRLESAGRITRRRDDEDERQVRIRLTPEGRQLRDKALQIPLEVGRAGKMDVAKIDALKSDLNRLRHQLDAALAGLDG